MPMQCISTLIIESGLGHQLGFYMSNCTKHSTAHTVHTYMYIHVHVCTCGYVFKYDKASYEVTWNVVANI